MANGITTLRLIMLFVLVALAYHAPPEWQFVNAPLVIAIFVLDAVDGYVARAWRETTTFGALYDVAADRIVEYVLWIVLTHLGYVPVWVPIVFCTRGVLVDVIRTHAASRGKTPFGMMHTRLGRWLVAGRFMRFSYAGVKLFVFGWILLLRPWPHVFPQFWADWEAQLGIVTDVLIYVAVALCLARGLPVIVDAVLAESMLHRKAARHSDEQPAAVRDRSAVATDR